MKISKLEYSVLIKINDGITGIKKLCNHFPKHNSRSIEKARAGLAEKKLITITQRFTENENGKRVYAQSDISLTQEALEIIKNEEKMAA